MTGGEHAVRIIRCGRARARVRAWLCAVRGRERLTEGTLADEPDRVAAARPRPPAARTGGGSESTETSVLRARTKKSNSVQWFEGAPLHLHSLPPLSTTCVEKNRTRFEAASAETSSAPQLAPQWQHLVARHQGAAAATAIATNGGRSKSG